MYQRCFDNASETLFVAGKTPRLSVVTPTY